MAHNYITPDIVTLPQLGGVKKDETTVPDSETYVSSNSWNEVVANVSAFSRTIPKAIVKANIQTTDITISDHDAVWGDGYTPSAANEGTGLFSIAFESSVSDALIDSGEADYVGLSEHSLSLWAATASVDYSGSSVYLPRVSVTANEISIGIYNASGTAVNPSDLDITLVVY